MIVDFDVSDCKSIEDIWNKVKKEFPIEEYETSIKGVKGFTTDNSSDIKIDSINGRKIVHLSVKVD